MTTVKGSPPPSRLARLRGHQWTPIQRATLIAAIAIGMACLFLTTYSLALGDPVARRIDAGVVGNPAARASTVEAVQGVARHSLVFRSYPSVPAARQAINWQHIYTALDLTSSRPTLYVASAAGASLARVLEKISAIDPAVRVVDTHPLLSRDPNGLDLFYLMLVATIIGFLTIFQVLAQAGRLALRHHVWFVLALALAASFALTLVNAALLENLGLHTAEVWGILALHLLAASSFALLMAVLIGRWALVPTWLFFVILGNASSGGAVSPPLLPQPFAFLSNWLPSGATVTAIRDAVYFRHYQHVHPVVVLAIWALVTFTAWLVIAGGREERGSAAAPAAAAAET
ncbi:MAG: DUF3533 domain-containing protein [Actinobacteria bacterium]|nr:MAG: DUF3533 domain-containing protein [Actinomycetota bacterium]